MRIFAKTMRDLRSGLVGWGIGVVGLTGLMIAVFPSVRDMPGWDELIAAYPEVMRELFAIETMNTGRGFLNAELFSIMMPILLLVFAIGRGARLVAGEEENGTLDVLLATPVPRTRVLIEQAAALAAGVSVLGGLLFTTVGIGTLLLDMAMSAGEIAAASAAVTLLAIEHGMIALAVGAATGKRTLAVGAASVVAAAGYALYALSQIVESFEPWRVISPFHHALIDGPLGAGARAEHLLLVAVSVIVLSAVVPRFAHRDIGTA